MGSPAIGLLSGADTVRIGETRPPLACQRPSLHSQATLTRPPLARTPRPSPTYSPMTPRSTHGCPLSQSTNYSPRAQHPVLFHCRRLLLNLLLVCCSLCSLFQHAKHKKWAQGHFFILSFPYCYVCVATCRTANLEGRQSIRFLYLS